ncbi:MAG: FMN-binding protein [Candidatus Omnitrophica bacterium]|nr:FMN-binding protein [Candidatus Omnitrophota bacterium]
MKKTIIKNYFIFLLAQILLLNFLTIVQAEQLIELDKALKKIYPKATAFEKEDIYFNDEQAARIAQKAGISFGQTHAMKVSQIIVKQNDHILGYAFEDTVIGKWGPIHYLLGLDLKGTIIETIVLDYQEIRGRPIAKSRFLRQYKGKNLRNYIRLRKDINGITGATISSRSITDGIRKLLFVFAELQQ